MVKQLTTWQCEICGSTFSSEERAASCEARGNLRFPGIAVGDFVTTDSENYGRFGWFDGDPAWTIKKPDGLHSEGSGNQWSLIYVVTAITQTGRRGAPTHIARYHLATRAMTAESGYNRGYTNVDHYHIRKLAPQPALDDSGLIGQIVDHDRSI